MTLYRTLRRADHGWVGEGERGHAGGLYRVAAPVLLVAVSPVVPNVSIDDCVRFGLLVAFAWLPACAVLGMVARRRPSRATIVAGVMLDGALLLLVQLVLQPGAVSVLLANIVLVGYYTHSHGRRVATVAGAVAAAVTIVVAVEGPNEIDAFTLSLYPFALLCVGWLLNVAATERGQARAGLIRLSEKSNAILSGIAEAVVVTSPTGRIEQWNPAAARTFGCDAVDAVDRACASVLGLYSDVRGLDCSNGCALLDARGGHEDVDVWRWVGTGQRQPLLASVAPVVDQDGTVVEIVHSFRDITRLKQADEAKTLFLATASHELKTPLTVIRGFSQLLLSQDIVLGRDERQTALRAIDVRAAQLTGIVDRLLMSSRIEAGRIELAPSAVDVMPILRERVVALESATGRTALLIGGDELPAAAVDRDAFTTVVDHLLDNSVKYSPNGGDIAVTVSADDEVVVIDVADEGVGMTEEQMAHCFERFWQAEATDVRRFGGTGLGLYIVRSLLEAMGATIAVSSRPGEGSTFHISLRRADRVTARRPEEEDTAASAEAGHGEPSMIREFMRQLGVPVEPVS